MLLQNISQQEAGKPRCSLKGILLLGGCAYSGDIAPPHGAILAQTRHPMVPLIPKYIKKTLRIFERIVALAMKAKPICVLKINLFLPNHYPSIFCTMRLR